MGLVSVKPGDLLYGTSFGVPSGQPFQLDERVVRLAELIKKRYPSARFGSSLRTPEFELSHHGSDHTPHALALALDVTIPGIKFTLSDQDAIFRDLQKFGVRGLGYAEDHYHLDFVDRGYPGLRVFADAPGATLTPNVVETEGFLPKGLSVLTASGPDPRRMVGVGLGLLAGALVLIGVSVWLEFKK